MCKEQKNIRLVGFIKGEKLAQLYTYARIFVLPSTHEGLPIALLEAMSYNCPVLASDIPANKEIDYRRNVTSKVEIYPVCNRL
mgnify:CR=1 FL=1